MPTPAQFEARIPGILQSVQLLSDAANAPISHYRQTVAEILGLLDYFKRMIAERDRYQAVVDRHVGRLHGMAFINLIETFERYLKETAAECVNCLAHLVVDDRFDIFKIDGGNLASQFGAGTLGRAMCESGTWLDCEEINKRFRRILADPFDPGEFYVFPKKGNQAPIAGQWRYDLVSLVWQMRHTAVHNVGVITQSDAVKMRVLAKSHVEAPRMLVPTRTDLVWLKLFLDETAEDCNQRIGQRLAELLTTIHADNPALFDSAQMANRISASFRVALTVDGTLGVVPP